MNQHNESIESLGGTVPRSRERSSSATSSLDWDDIREEGLDPDDLYRHAGDAPFGAAAVPNFIRHHVGPLDGGLGSR